VQAQSGIGGYCCKGEAEDLERWMEELVDRSTRPPQIAWEPRLEEVSSQGPDAVISSFEAAQVMSSYTVVLNSSPLIGETVGGLSVFDMAPDAEYVNLVCDE
jgi:hypothetical protein